MSTSVCFPSYCGPFDVQNQWSSFIYPGGGVVWQFMTRKGVVSWALHHICLQLSLLPHPIHLKDVNKYESGDFQTLELIALCERERNQQTLDFWWLQCGYSLGKKSWITLQSIIFLNTSKFLSKLSNGPSLSNCTKISIKGKMNYLNNMLRYAQEHQTS